MTAAEIEKHLGFSETVANALEEFKNQPASLQSSGTAT